MNDETKHRQYMVGMEGSFKPAVQRYQDSVNIPASAVRSEVEWRSGLLLINGVECTISVRLAGTDRDDLAALLNALVTAQTVVLNEVRDVVTRYEQQQRH